MKKTLQLALLFISISNYAQYNESSKLANEDLYFEKAIISSNPTRGLLNIKNIALDKATVYDVLGKLKKTFIFLTVDENHQIDLYELSKGIYFIVLESGNKTAKRKIIIN